MVINPVIVKSEITGRILLVLFDKIFSFKFSFFLFNSLALGPIGTEMTMTSLLILNSRTNL